MTSINPRPTYHLAPDLSIPPPPKGPLHLGTVVTDLNELIPLNYRSRIAITEDEVFSDTKVGFTSTFAKLRSSEWGVWAKIFGVEGFGGKLNWLHSRRNDETISVDRLETTFFNPSVDYMTQVLAVPNIKAYVESTQKKAPVFMVTGIKVAIGATLSKSKTEGDEANAGFGAVKIALATDLGPKAGIKNVTTMGAGFEGSTSFVLGIRVRKIYWKRIVVKDKEHVAGAVLGNKHRKPPVLVSAGFEFIDDFGGASAVGFRDESQASIDGDDSLMTDEEMAMECETVDNPDGVPGIESSVWILPRMDKD